MTASYLDTPLNRYSWILHCIVSYLKFDFIEMLSCWWWSSKILFFFGAIPGILRISSKVRHPPSSVIRHPRKSHKSIHFFTFFHYSSISLTNYNHTISHIRSKQISELHLEEMKISHSSVFLAAECCLKPIKSRFVRV